MSARILDGKAAANQIQQTIASAVLQRQSQGLRPPSLAVILVGEDPASQVYVKNKRKACQDVGIRSLAYDLPATTTQTELLQLIDELRADATIDGILVQLPLPPHIDADVILDRIPSDKDVDGFHAFNIGRLAQRRPVLRPCTPYGVILLLEYAGFTDLEGLHAVVVGASNNVGRPMALELLLTKCTVTICHRFTRDLATHVGLADLLVVATGKRGVVQSEWIKPGAIVVDIGMHRHPDGSLNGDVDFDSAKMRASWITPVPGGVGPMTVATLLKNTLYTTEMFHTEVPPFFKGRDASTIPNIDLPPIYRYYQKLKKSHHCYGKNSQTRRQSVNRNWSSYFNAAMAVWHVIANGHHHHAVNQPRF